MQYVKTMQCIKATNLTSSRYVEIQLSKDIKLSNGIECIFSMIQSEWFNNLPQMISKRMMSKNTNTHKVYIPKIKKVLTILTLIFFGLCVVGATIQGTTVLIYEIMK